MNPPRSFCGFTLIELMIAISLGLLIVYTATAAFRVASQSVTLCNRLSLENATMRAGFQMAHHELDFWTSIDNPDDSSRQGLRAGGLATGMPFTPFSTSWPGAISNSEDAIGHDQRDTAWAMGNPRVWWRGNMAEKDNTDLRFGRYSLFANRSTTLSAAQLSTISSIPSLTYSPGNAITVPHSWIYEQISGLEKALGFYGLCDYLPANAVYAYYDPWNGGCNLGGMPFWLVNPSGPFNNGDGGQQTARGKYRNSYMTSYGIINPKASDDPNTLRDLHRQNYHLGYFAPVDSIDGFNKISDIPDDFMAIRPANWPGLTVSVQRLIKNTRFANIARIRCSNALSGEAVELSFSGFGTTLRGARQQRKKVDGSWVKWDNSTTAANDLTLDSN